MEEKLIAQPENLRKNLYPHQLRNVYRMEEMERTKKVIWENEGERIIIETSIGILADDTGYGKTVCVVACVLRDKMSWSGPDYVQKVIETPVKSYVTTTSFYSYPKNDVTLVLVSPSILSQWVDEFSYTDLRVGVVKNKKQALELRASEYHVVIVISTHFRPFIQRYSGISWKRFVYDEPGQNHVPKMSRVLAGFTWLISATPYDIRGSYRQRSGFLQELTRENRFNSIVKYIQVRNTPEDLQKSFEMPPPNHAYHICRSNIHKALRGLVSQSISDMIKGGNILGAIQALGGTHVSTMPELIQLVLAKKQDELKDVRYHLHRWEEKKDPGKVELWRNRENNILYQISELEQRVKDMIGGLCPICFDHIKNPVMEPGCKNMFCSACLLEWMREHKNCPMCRGNVLAKDLVFIGEQKYEEEKISEFPSKTEVMVELIRTKPTGKFIIYSAYEDSFQGIRGMLDQLAIPFIEVSGTADQRAKKLEKFREQVNVAFLNSKQDSAGINMQEATDIIVYHEMSPNILQQIIGRANRIGRKGSVTIHHLKIDGEP